MSHKLEITQGIGYAGKLRSRAWVAEITGTDPHYGLSREFRDPERVERDRFNSQRYIRTYIHDLPAGLYEVSERGERWYLLVYPRKDGSGACNPPEERVLAMARLMDDGMEFEAARIATKVAS